MQSELFFERTFNGLITYLRAWNNFILMHTLCYLLSFFYFFSPFSCISKKKAVLLHRKRCDYTYPNGITNIY